ncbi:MAG: hypothetical protein R3B48_09000 [Kofleriaceae bacterium]
MKASTLLFVALLPTLGCFGGEAPELSSAASEVASSTNPIDHGALPWGVAQTATITSAEGFHAWQLTVSDPVTATFATSAVAGAVDTVLVLYRQQASGGWGTAIASNNNGPTPPWSQLSLSLSAGTYRVMVKRASRSVTGPFALTASCSGAGCGVCNPEPLELTPEDASALDAPIATFNAGARNGFSWCGIRTTQELYSTPACPEEPVDLAAIVEQVLATNWELYGYSFTDGTVLTETQIAQALPFTTSCSPGGPGVAQAVAEHVSAQTPQGWTITSEVLCHNCHEFNHYLVLWYPDGQVLVLPYFTGYDS